MRNRSEVTVFCSTFMVATIVLVIGAAQPAVAVLGPDDCVDFEDLTPATVYNVGGSFADSGVIELVPGFRNLESSNRTHQSFNFPSF